MDQLEYNTMNSDLIPHGNMGNQNAAKPKRERLDESRTFRFKSSELTAMKRAARSLKINGESVPLRLWVRIACCEKAGHELPDMETD